MELLGEIICHPGIHKNGKAVRREAVRGIIRRGSTLLMIYSPKNGDYKFPGGGILPGETQIQALVREIQEECGAASVEITGDYGKVVEYDHPFDAGMDVFCMTSYYYNCQVNGSLGVQQLDDYERDLGFTPRWVEVDEAIRANRIVLESPRCPRWVRRETWVLERIKGELVD